MRVYKVWPSLSHSPTLRKKNLCVLVKVWLGDEGVFVMLYYVILGHIRFGLGVVGMCLKLRPLYHSGGS